MNNDIKDIDDMVTDQMTTDKAVENVMNNTIRVAINGCGRIGRAFVRMASDFLSNISASANLPCWR